MWSKNVRNCPHARKRSCLRACLAWLDDAVDELRHDEDIADPDEITGYDDLYGD